MKNQGFKEIYLEAVKTSKAIMELEDLIKFYEKFGFKEYNRKFDDRLRNEIKIINLLYISF